MLWIEQFGDGPIVLTLFLGIIVIHRFEGIFFGVLNKGVPPSILLSSLIIE